MIRPKQISSQRAKKIINQQPLFNSQENSFIQRQSYSDENFKCDTILNEERSIIKNNLDKLKNLLSENKQFAKKTRADISPQKSHHMQSIDNFKYCTPKNQSSSKSKPLLNSHSRSKNSLSPKKLDSNTLIADIKKKIQGSPSPSRYHTYLAEGYFTKDLVRPQTISLYKDEIVNTNKQINLLVKENQKYQSEIQDQNVLISQLNSKINELQSKLQNVITLAQQNEEKFHAILYQKEELIRKQILEKEETESEIRSSFQNFFQFYMEKIAYFIKKVNMKVISIEKRLSQIQTKQLSKMHKKIKLQKLIFESQSPYRKSKNLLEKSPSVKGDNFQDLQQKRHQLQIQMFQKQVQYEKNQYQKTIQSYKQSYDDLYAKFLQAQKRNQNFKSQIKNMKQQQQKFMKQHEQKQKKFQEERKMNENQHKYFKKQLAHVKIQEDFSVQENNNNHKSLLNTPKSLSRSKESPKSLYLKLNQDISGKSDRIKQNEKKTQKAEQMFKQKEKKLLERQIELELKEKQLQLRQKQFEQHIKVKQQYFDQINHIKNILTTVKQSSSQSLDIKVDEKKNKQGKSPLKLKQLSKIEYLAKKQKKQKEIAQSKLQTMEKQLEYQKTKNSQLQQLIGEKENKLFQQIKEISSSIDNEPVCQQLEESIILEEQLPFDPMLQSLKKSKNDQLNSIIENDMMIDWQSKVKDRLEDTIQRLQALEQLSSPRQNQKEELFIKQ